MQFQFVDDQTDISVDHSLLLNCLNSGKQIRNTRDTGAGEVTSSFRFSPARSTRVY